MWVQPVPPGDLGGSDPRGWLRPSGCSAPDAQGCIRVATGASSGAPPRSQGPAGRGGEAQPPDDPESQNRSAEQLTLVRDQQMIVMTQGPVAQGMNGDPEFRSTSGHRAPGILAGHPGH
jgi:hypothetical protein